jgi:hypothetical protein
VAKKGASRSKSSVTIFSTKFAIFRRTKRRRSRRRSGNTGKPLLVVDPPQRDFRCATFTYRSTPSLDGSDHRGLHIWLNASIVQLNYMLSMTRLSMSRSSSPVHRMMRVAGEQVHPFPLKKVLAESLDLLTAAKINDHEIKASSRYGVPTKYTATKCQTLPAPVQRGKTPTRPGAFAARNDGVADQ